MADWRDDPDIKAAIARADELTSAWLARAEDTIRAAGFPVCVVHGYLEDDTSVDLICGRLPEAAARHGSVRHVGGSDATTYLFPGGHEAAGFTAEVLGWPDLPSWWRITPTATPRYDP